MPDQKDTATKRLLWSLGLWLAIALIQTYQSYYGMMSEGARPLLDRTLALQLGSWLPWAFLTIPIIRLSRSYPIERLLSVRSLVLYPAVGLFLVMIDIAIHTGAMKAFPWPGEQPRTYLQMLASMMQWMYLQQFIVYAGIVGVVHASDYYKKFRERELHTAELQRQLSEAQLQALQMQLQPHFLYNTLHTISSLVRDHQGKMAVNMIARLSELLRYTLEHVHEQTVPLKKEAEFLERYLEIERTRFSDRLIVKMELGKETLSALVPSLILQPLVENAIRHGVARKTTKGTLTVRSRQEGGLLLLEVINTGTRLAKDWEQRTKAGVGIKNTRSRLQQLYGELQTFTLSEPAGRSVCASISIPFERAKPTT